MADDRTDPGFDRLKDGSTAREQKNIKEQMYDKFIKRFKPSVRALDIVIAVCVVALVLIFVFGRTGG